MYSINTKQVPTKKYKTVYKAILQHIITAQKLQPLILKVLVIITTSETRLGINHYFF